MVINLADLHTGINDQRLHYAKSCGIDSEDIELLLEYGYDAGTIEELLYDPSLFQSCMDEISYLFMHSVEKEKQDKELLDKLWEERDGIVAKAIKAARKLLKNNFVFPTCHVAESMKTSWAKSESLSIIQFVQSCCDIGALGVRTYTHRLYSVYIRYCSQNDYEIESENLFSRVLGNQFRLKRSRWSEDGNTAQRGFIGIRLV